MEYASEQLQNDEEVVLAAVTDCGVALQYASDKLQNDKAIVLAAVSQDGNAFDHASEDLQDDLEVVQTAIIQLLIKRYNIMDTDNTEHENERELKEMGRSICELVVSKQLLAPLEIIHIASARGLHWDHGMSKLIEQDCTTVLDCKDETTGLYPFMTFASSSDEQEKWRIDLNTLFEMIKKHPQIVQLYNGDKQTVRMMSTNKKRDNDEITIAGGDVNDITKLRKLY